MGSVNINTTATTTSLVTCPSAPFAFIRVWGFDIISGGTSNVKFTDANNNIYAGPYPLVANSGISKAVNDQVPAFDLPKGQNLNLVQDGSSIQLSGSLQYQIIMPN